MALLFALLAIEDQREREDQKQSINMANYIGLLFYRLTNLNKVEKKGNITRETYAVSL
jgi:hypothetical protein